MLDILQQVATVYEQNGRVRLWWRGHADSSWRLHPSIYHRGLAHAESSMYAAFHQAAPAIDPTLASRTQNLDWLFLMQHHGLPTRLLDWSESALVALYFAASHVPDNQVDGTIWWLDPATVNQAELGESKMMGAGGPDIWRIASGALGGQGDDPEQSRIAAFYPDQTEPRHMVQRAQCTIHGREQPLEDMNSLRLGRIDIPAARKAEVWR